MEIELAWLLNEQPVLRFLNRLKMRSEHFNCKNSLF